MVSTPDSESGNPSSNLGGTSCKVRMCLGARDTIVVIASRVKMQNPSFAKRKLFGLGSLVKFVIYTERSSLGVSEMCYWS